MPAHATAITTPTTLLQACLAGGLALMGCEETDSFEGGEPSLEDAQLEADEALELGELDAPAPAPAGTDTTPPPAPADFMTCTPGSGIDTGTVVAIHDLPSNPLQPVSCTLAAGLPPGWSAAPTFPVVAGQTAPWKLQAYCSYDFAGGQPTQLDYDHLYQRLTTVPGLAESAAVDCVSMDGMGGLDGDPEIEEGLYQAFRENVDALDSVQGGSLENVGLYVLDQIQEWEFASTTPHHHGHNMGYIARDLLCPDFLSSYCDDNLHFELALPREHDGQFEPHLGGGYVGSYGDVVSATYRAVMRWQAQYEDPNNQNPERRFVLLAAFGAARELDPNFDRGPYAAMRDVLDLVACQGGLFVGSVGNASDPGCAANDGALYPAVFAGDLTPSAQTCADLGVVPLGVTPNPLDVDPYPISYEDRTLVEAVGMVDAWDELPALSRDNATPNLLTYGTQVWVPNPTGNMVPLTGTSVSAAVSAATFTLVWALRPELTAREVRQLVYDAGYDTGLNTEIGKGVQGQPAHRVSLCAAVEDACSPLATCPVTHCASAAAPAADGNREKYQEAVAKTLEGGSVTLTPGGAMATATAICLNPDADRMSHPTPENPACPQCDIDVDDGGGSVHSLHIDLLAEYKFGQLHEVQGGHIKTFDVIGAETGQFDLTPDQVNLIINAAPDEVTTVDFDVAAPHSAALIFDLASGRQAIGEVPCR